MGNLFQVCKNRPNGENAGAQLTDDDEGEEVVCAQTKISKVDEPKLFDGKSEKIIDECGGPISIADDQISDAAVDHVNPLSVN